jgi:hypothetical protein
MAECLSSLAKGVQASCTAIKKVGGLDKRIYLGAIGDLDTVTIGSNNTLTSLTFLAAKGFVLMTGRKEKNSAGSDIEVGENVTLRNQTLNLSVYYDSVGTQATIDLESIDSIIDNEGMFAIVETNAGTLEVFGINKTNWDGYGLKVSANPGTSGLLLNDSTAFAMVMTGGFTNLQLIYNPSASLATNIAALDALVIDP